MAGRSNFRRFLRYVKPYWYLIVLAAMGGIVKFTVPLVFPQVLSYLVDNVLNAGSLMTLAEKQQVIIRTSVGVLALYLVIYLPFTYIRHYAAQKASNNTIFDLRYDLYLHIQQMSASYYNSHQSGSIVARLINDISQAQNLIGNALTNIWIDGLVIFFLLFVMFRISVPLTWISLAIFPPYILFTKKFKRRIKEASRRVQDGTEAMQGNLQEKVTGFNVVQSFTREPEEQQNFQGEARALLQDSLSGAKWSGLNNTVGGFLTGIAPVLVVFAGSFLILKGQLTLGQMILFYSYLGSFYLPVNRFSELTQVISTSMAAVDRIFEVIDMPPEIQDAPTAVACTRDDARDVEFRHVDFTYHNASRASLHDVDFKIKEGENIAIVGPSGSGKTTIINLIARFYDVTGGAILIGGRDLREYTLRSLRQNIGMVFQESLLFCGSIRDNIRFGNPKASDQQVREASDKANATQFILEQESGFDTMIGERGTRLSGGQRQRIAIARVFLKDPRILILDEATSALDSESEIQVQRALEKLMAGRTTIVIAHRLSTIMNADRILVVSNGSVMEEGNHAQLLARNGLYRHLYDNQYR
ncbi:MAG: ABC transporter ATP-binding protein [Sphaerochaetaceae bacterium]